MAQMARFFNVTEAISHIYESHEPVLDLVNLNLTEFPTVPDDLKPYIQFIYAQGNQFDTLPDLREYTNLSAILCGSQPQFGVVGTPVRILHRFPALEWSPVIELDEDALDQHFRQFYQTFQQTGDYNAFKQALDAYWDAEAARIQGLQQSTQNLNTFRQGLVPHVEGGVTLYNFPQNTTLSTLPGNLSEVVGSYLSGETGTLQQQKLKLQEKLSRPIGGPGVGGRRKTRKGSKRKLRKSSKRQRR